MNREVESGKDHPKGATKNSIELEDGGNQSEDEEKKSSSSKGRGCPL